MHRFPTLLLVVGALLLTLGKRLFWLFVAGAGFLAGLQFAPRLLPGQPAKTSLTWARPNRAGANRQKNHSSERRDSSR